jgi:WD40 repeat protein
MRSISGIFALACLAAASVAGCIAGRSPEETPTAPTPEGRAGLPFFKLDSHEGKVTRVIFSPRSNFLASLSEDTFDRSTIIFWHAAMGSVIDSFTNTGFVERDIDFSPDGSTIGIGSRTTVLIDSYNYKLKRVFDPETYDFFKTIDVSANTFAWPFAFKTYQVEHRYRYVTSMAFSADGRYVLSGHENGQIKVWEIKTGDLLNVLWGTRVFGGVLDVEFSPDGRFIAACQDDERIRVWRFPDYMEKVLTGQNGAVYSLAFNPVTGDLVSAGDDGEIRIWDIESGHAREVIAAHEKAILSVEVSRDGRTLVTGSKDNTVRLWDARTGRMIVELDGHERQVNSVALNSNSTLLASGSDDETVRVWDISSLRLCENIALTPEPLFPAKLEGDARFEDAGGDGALSPGETGRFILNLINRGEGAAYNLVTLAIPDSLAVGMEIETPGIVPMLLPGRRSTRSVVITNIGPTEITGVKFTFRILESNGFHLSPPLRAVLAPN